jgi:putative endonuclease
MMKDTKMTKKQAAALGDWGEDLACRHLESLGYKILERQWRFSKAEIDIIAMDRDVLVFAEVKTKSYNYYGEPEESISPQKEKLIIDGAQAYMEKIHHDWEIRFDIVSILVDDKQVPSIRHYKDAFFPGLE